MKRTILLILLIEFSCLGCTSTGPESVGTSKSSAIQTSFSTIRPVGRLGFPIGTYLRIEGHRYIPTQPPFKIVGRMLLVDKVQGKRLDVPVKLQIKNADIDSLDVKTRCVLNGYEAGVWAGSPENLPPDTPAESTVFHFHPYFVVISVKAPKGLQIK